MTLTATASDVFLSKENGDAMRLITVIIIGCIAGANYGDAWLFETHTQKEQRHLEHLFQKDPSPHGYVLSAKAIKRTDDPKTGLITMEVERKTGFAAIAISCRATREKCK